MLAISIIQIIDFLSINKFLTIIESKTVGNGYLKTF